MLERDAFREFSVEYQTSRAQNEPANFWQQVQFFAKAQFIKSNPDSPQRKLRHLALVEGKLYLAVPKLAHAKPFRN